MYKALVLKELRESIGIAAIAMVAYIAVIGNLTGYRVLPFGPYSNPTYSIPFHDTPFLSWFSFISVGFAIALGLKQTFGESWRGTWLSLLHRPLDRRKIIAVKMAVGVAIYLFFSAIAVLIYAAWAATPGTHASPFRWWMTLLTWKSWLVISACYFAAFLTGLWPGHWFGTRLMPLIAISMPTMLIVYIPYWQILGWPALALMCSLLIYITFYVLRTRDYS